MDNLLPAWVAVITVSDRYVVSNFGTFDIDGFDFDMSKIIRHAAVLACIT